MKKTKQINIMGFLIVCFIIVGYAYVSWKYSYRWIDSDSSSEIMFGKLLAETNSVLSDQWYYSTAISVFNINIIYLFCWKLFNSWKIVRVVSQVDVGKETIYKIVDPNGNITIEGGNLDELLK